MQPAIGSGAARVSRRRSTSSGSRTFAGPCGDGRRFQLKRKTKRKRKRATLQRIVDELRRIRHSPIDGQGRWLATVLRGHYVYFAVPTNLPAVRALRNHVKMHLFLSLWRRSQRYRLTWSRFGREVWCPGNHC
jgi:RNA-directed DNA polymerase